MVCRGGMDHHVDVLVVASDVTLGPVPGKDGGGGTDDDDPFDSIDLVSFV